MSELCPKCSSPVWRDSVDLGVRIYYGPYGCPECGWSEWKEYDFSNGESTAQLENPNHHVHQWGLHPNVNKRKPMKLYAVTITKKHMFWPKMMVMLWNLGPKFTVMKKKILNITKHTVTL